MRVGLAALSLMAMAVSVVGSPAFAADTAGQYTIRGMGLTNCARWAADHKAKNAGYDATESWIFGYVTAFNAYKASVKDIALGVDADAMDAWLDGYCDANPQASIAAAGLNYVTYLQDRGSAK